MAQDDSSTADVDEAWEHLVDVGDDRSQVAFLLGLPSGQVARLLEQVNEEQRIALLNHAPAGAPASWLEQFPAAQAATLVEKLEASSAAARLGYLPSDFQADVLHELDADTAEAVLGAMEPDEARQIRLLASYDPDHAGGLMVTEYLAYTQETTVQGVCDDMVLHAERYRDYVVQYSYVTDSAGRLVGVLRLRDLLLAPRRMPIGDLMLPDPIRVGDTEPLDRLRQLFDEHRFFGVPVVDAGGRLVGLVRRAGVEEALADQVGSDYLKTQGIVGGEELRSMPIFARSGRRLSWLGANIFLNVIAASVIAAYQETLAAVIALAVFLPIISDMSGCSGNQAVAVSMRELALGLARPTDLARVLAKEAAVGLINGFALGLLIAGVAFAWKGNAWLGLVVGVALMTNTLVSVSLGGCLPLLMRRLGVDPALASGPVLTTVTDMCGFFFVLALATALLPRLTG